MSPELLATVFTGLSGLLLVYLQSRKEARDELRDDLENTREELERARDRLEACEEDRDEWRSRYYGTLEGANAETKRPEGNSRTEGGRR